MTARIKARPGPPRRGPAGIPAVEWRNAAYRRWGRTACRCAVCFAQYPDPAHGPVNGIGSKGPDSGCIWLCRMHHDEQHVMDWPAFQERYGIDRVRLAARSWKAFQQSRRTA
jgi:hypothetical protein